MKEIIKNTFIMFAITLVAGVLLALVFNVTAAPRAEQQELAKQNAYRAVFADGAEFRDANIALEPLYEEVAEMGVTPDVAKVTEVVAAFSESGEHLGDVLTVESYKGYGGTIKFTVGIRMDGTVNGYSLLSISETAGLGMKAKEDPFASQFRNKKVDHFEYTKDGAKADNQVDAISGATKTTKAIVYGTNAAIYTFNLMHGEGGTN
ncbi:MAG: FMN-binding protein [Parasporobacterium sp.]|nr:FMN-binding protein [Parasporobacterium sp.]